MKSNEITWLKRLFRYGSVFISQLKENREYAYFWILTTVCDVVLFETVKPLSLSLFAVLNLLLGLLAIGTVVRPIDNAFETIGLDYSKGYGDPTWIVRGKYPLKHDSFRIRAAGYDSSDFEKNILQLSSRLNQPIKAIRKPSPTIPEIEVILKRSDIPNTLSFASLDFNTLAQGEFFIGQSNEGIEKLSLTKMIHMLVAGQTGAGKTQFLKQFLTTVLTHTRGAYVCLIDMKGGIDFQEFMNIPNLKLVTSYSDAEIILDECVALFEKRKAYLLKKNKTNWSELSLKELEKEEELNGYPLGPVIVMVDELAELSKLATGKSSKSLLQEKIATLARLSRFAGIHLVLGTQRPDKSTLSMQSKDNLPTRVCFSVPSVVASNLVIGDMTASSLGSHPGRAVYQLAGNKIIQAPLLNPKITAELISSHKEKLAKMSYTRGLMIPPLNAALQHTKVVLK